MACLNLDCYALNNLPDFFFPRLTIKTLVLKANGSLTVQKTKTIPQNQKMKSTLDYAVTNCVFFSDACNVYLCVILYYIKCTFVVHKMQLMHIEHTSNVIILCTFNVHVKYMKCTLRCTFPKYFNCTFNALTKVLYMHIIKYIVCTLRITF